MQDISFSITNTSATVTLRSKLYALAKWCQIITEGARNLLFSDDTLEERVEAVELEEMAE